MWHELCGLNCVPHSVVLLKPYVVDVYQMWPELCGVNYVPRSAILLKPYVVDVMIIQFRTKEVGNNWPTVLTVYKKL